MLLVVRKISWLRATVRAVWLGLFHLLAALRCLSPPHLTARFALGARWREGLPHGCDS